MGGKNKRIKEFEPVTCVLPVNLPCLNEKAELEGLSIDRIYVLLHQIYVVWIYDELNDVKKDGYFHLDGWVTLSATRLQVLCTHKYKAYEKFLIRNNVIEIKYNQLGLKSYVSGVRCTPYRINPRLLSPKNGRRFKHTLITDYKTLKAINNDQNKFENGQYSVELQKTIEFSSVHNEMHSMLSSFYFDTIGLSKFISKVGSGQIILKRKSIRGIIDAEMVAYSINLNGISKPIVCSFGERFHTTFTRLPREYRSFLKIKDVNEPLCSVDIANCQVYIVAIILAFPDEVKKVLPEFEYVLDKIKKVTKTKLRLFLEYCVTGKIYEYWQDERGLAERDDAKLEIIKRVLFDSLPPQKKYQEIRSLFELRFDDVWEGIQIMKSITSAELPMLKSICIDDKGNYDDNELHKTLSCMCQRFESRVLTGMVVPSLLKKGVGPFLTIHDSVLIPESKSLLAKEIFIACFERLGVKPPTIKIDSYGSIPDDWT